MADFVNLRRARKQAARKTKERQAADNRVKFGTPAELRTMAAAERQRLDRRLSAARLDRPGKPDDLADIPAGSDGHSPDAPSVFDHTAFLNRET